MATLTGPAERHEGERASLPGPTHQLVLSASSSRSQSSPAVRVALYVAGPLALLAYAEAHVAWLLPFFRDLNRWLAHPAIGGAPTAPARWPVAALWFGLAALAAWLLAGLVAHDRAGLERSGLTLILVPALVGLVGTVALILGQLSTVVVWAGLLLLTAGLGVVYLRVRDRLRESKEQEATGPSSRLAWVAAGAVALVFAFTVVHAAMAPVTEWDAIIYHAGAARFWFLTAPAPPLVYGPSAGFEMSSNYPPLFPAAGAATYVAIGAFEDVYLRLFSPVLFLGTLLLTFGYGRRVFSSRAAAWSVILLVGTPLLVLYAAWPTNYTLFTALFLATAIACQRAGRGETLAPWVLAGVLAGLCTLSHLYGLTSLGIGVAAWLVWSRSRSGALRVGAFALTALLVAAPWLLRNFVVLGDPFYPVWSPPFHGRGLVEPFHRDAVAGIRGLALSYFASGRLLPLSETLRALFDMHLLPIGLLVALIAGLFAFVRRNLPMQYLFLVLLGILAATLAPGWYFLRSLLPALPFAALLTGPVLASALDRRERAGSAGPRWLRGAGRLCVRGLLAAILVASLVVGICLAVAGPNQVTWTTLERSSPDLLLSVRTLGDRRATIAMVDGSELLGWEWLNTHLGPHDRLATTDSRVANFRRPQNLRYLEGRYGASLRRLRDPAAVLARLRQDHVKYIWVPWFIQQRPRAMGRLPVPLFAMLGGRDFPLVGTVLQAPMDPPNGLFAVGPASRPAFVAPFPGTGSPPPASLDGPYVVRVGSPDAALSVPTFAGWTEVLTFQYLTTGTGSFALRSPPTGTTAFRAAGTRHADWRSARIVVRPAALGYTEFQLVVSGAPLRLRDVKLATPFRRPLPAG